MTRVKLNDTPDTFDLLMLHWSVNRNRSHVVRVSSPLRNAIMDTGEDVPFDSIGTLPPADPSADDLASGPSAAAVGLVAHRKQRGIIYTHACDALVACGKPGKYSDSHALDECIARIAATRTDHSFILCGETCHSVAFQLITRVVTGHARTMAALRLLNTFAGGLFHVSINQHTNTSTWTTLPVGRLSSDVPIAILQEAMPVEMRQQAGIGGEPTGPVTRYQLIREDFGAVGFDERDQRTLWQAINAARYLLEGNRDPALVAMGVPPNSIGAHVDVVMFGHFVYRRTVEWLVSAINMATGHPPPPTAVVQPINVCITCIPQPRQPDTSPHSTLDAL